mmetsp:Transcript_19498/g.30492  ORF Transcript_19498/g.30492 Transcript_19498/m.30492 type:complete len:217 (-) Transcript_19498:1721-2371(-)
MEWTTAAILLVKTNTSSCKHSVASVNCRISQNKKIHETVVPCFESSRTSFFRPLSRLLRIISTPALPNPTFINDPIRNRVFMRNVVSIPLRTSLPHVECSAKYSSSSIKSRYSFVFVYPSGSFISILRSLTIRSMGSTTRIITGPTNNTIPRSHTIMMKRVVIISTTALCFRYFSILKRPSVITPESVEVTVTYKKSRSRKFAERVSFKSTSSSLL